MERQIKSAFEMLRVASSSMSEEEQRKLGRVLLNLADWLAVHQDSEGVDAGLVKLGNYVKRLGSSSGLKSSSKTDAADVLYYMMKSRGLTLSHVPRAELRKAQTYFWRLLVDIADKWESSELSNLLSYSLRNKIRIPPNEMAPRAVVRLHEHYFKSLPPEQRDHLFSDVLRRFSSEASFRRQVLRALERKE